MSERVRKKSEIIGALYRTWALFDTYTDDGILHGYDAETLDSIVGIPGWSMNLQHVGWLVIETQSLVMPSFETWLSSSAKARLKDAQRKRNERKGASDSCPKSVRKSADKKRTTGEERTVLLKKEEAAAAQLVASWAMPANASERRHRQALAAWQCVRKRAHGHYLDEISWEAAAMKYQHLSPDEWHAALMLSVERQSKGLCVRDYRDEQSRAAKSKPKQTKPRLLTEEEIERYNTTGELPEGALDQIGT